MYRIQPFNQCTNEQMIFTYHVSRFTDSLSCNNQIHTTTHEQYADDISQGERLPQQD